MTMPIPSSSPSHGRHTLSARLVRTGHLLVPTVLTVFLLPFSLHAQRAYAGAVGGRTSTELPDQIFHNGSMAGLFFQVDLAEHLALRSEAGWVQVGAIEYLDIYSAPPAGTYVKRDLEYADVNVMGRLSWATGVLQPMNSKVGISLVGGGWLGAHIQGAVHEVEPRSVDFGHIVGMGLFWNYDSFLAQIDARSVHGEVRFWKDGPRRKNSELVLSLGYRIH